MSSNSTILLTSKNEHWYIGHANLDKMFLEFNWGDIELDVDEEGFTITIEKDTPMYDEILKIIGLWGMRDERKQAAGAMITLAKEFGVTRDEMIALLDELKP